MIALGLIVGNMSISESSITRVFDHHRAALPSFHVRQLEMHRVRESLK